MSPEQHIFLSSGFDNVSSHFLNLFESFEELFIDRTIIRADNLDTIIEKDIEVHHDTSLPDFLYNNIMSVIFENKPLIKISLFCGSSLATCFSVYNSALNNAPKYYMTEYFDEPSINFSFYQIHQLKNYDLLSINNHWLQ